MFSTRSGTPRARSALPENDQRGKKPNDSGRAPEHCLLHEAIPLGQSISQFIEGLPDHLRTFT